MHSYKVYFTTNANRTVLYIGVTNDLSGRMQEHLLAAQAETGFTGKYKVYHLIYFEEYALIDDAIAREKQLKGWTRAKKEAIIRTKNPGWRFLETDIQ